MFGENMNSIGLEFEKPSTIRNCALVALVMLSAMYAGQT